MADVRRTKAEVLALIADNVIGAISAQDIRDWLVSAWGGYGMLIVNDGTTSQVTGGATPVLFTGFSSDGSDGPSNGFTVSSATDRITVDTDCVIMATCGFAFSGTNNALVEVYLYKNGVDTGIGFHRKLGTGGDVGSGGFSGIVSCSANDYLQIYLETPDGTASVLGQNVQLSVCQIS